MQTNYFGTFLSTLRKKEDQRKGKQIFEVFHQFFTHNTIMVHVSDDINDDINFNYPPVILSKNGFPYHIQFVSRETLQSHRDNISPYDVYRTFEGNPMLAYIAPDQWSMRYVSKNNEIKEIC